jgi:arylformamidase
MLILADSREGFYLGLLSASEKVIHDLSLRISSGMPVFPGDPQVLIERRFEILKDGCNLSRVTLGSHAGTHVDLPLHFISGGAGADTVSLENFIGRAFVQRFSWEGRAITASGITDFPSGKADILLVATGWDEKYGTASYYDGFPFFDSGLVDFMLENGVKALGTDGPSVDPAGSEPVFHRRALGAGLALIEGLTSLCHLQGKIVTFYAVPLKLAGCDGSPVRAFAVES